MSKSKVILIVDDDKDIRLYLKKLLENMGHQVIESTNIAGGLLLLNHYIPHLVLIDVNLEEENGFQFVVKIKEIDPYDKISIIMMSSRASKKLSSLVDRFETGFLEKPINNKTLLTTIKKLIPKMDFKQTTKIREKNKFPIAECIGDIIRISETHLILRSKIKFTDKEKLDLQSIFLKKYSLDRIPLITDGTSRDSSAGVYDTHIHLIGLKESDYIKIRRLNRE